MNFRFLGGKLLRPRYPSLVQTDGSYHRGRNAGYAAALLFHDNKKYKHLLYLDNAQDSCETEWASVYNGLVFSLEKNVSEINIENDNLGVVKNLTEYTNKEKYRNRTKNKKEYAEHYKHEILKLTKYTKWTGIRWIPRGLNRADDIFRDGDAPFL